MSSTANEQEAAATGDRTPPDLSFDDPSGRNDDMASYVEWKVEQLAGQTAETLHSDEFQEWYESWLSLQSELHDYSYRNQMLIQAQYPGATMVAGYNQWQDLGRQVQEGEEAIWILRPIIEAKCPECGNAPGYHQYVDCNRTETGHPDSWDEGVVGFTDAAVFDISQTDGDPIEKPPIETVGDDNKARILRDVFTSVAELRGYDVAFVSEADWNRASEGFARQKAMDLSVEIRVRERDSPAAEVGTLVHELAHAERHFNVDEKPEKQKREVEAESIAHVVCERFGLDASNSANYLAQWAGESEEMIRERLQTISTASHDIITDAERYLAKDGYL